MNTLINNIKYFIISITLLGLFVQGTRFDEELNVKLELPAPIPAEFIFQQQLENSGLSYSIFELAYQQMNEYVKQVHLNKDTILTIIDFDQPSTEERLFVIDIKNKTIVKRALVAHGTNTGITRAQNFSNTINSHQSSLGMYLTDNVYQGKHGYSLKLDGLESGVNDNARKRAIVMHGANYVSENFIQKHGRLGRSFGCPALSYSDSKEVINLIKEKSFLFIYHNSYNTKLVADNQEIKF